MSSIKQMKLGEVLERALFLDDENKRPKKIEQLLVAVSFMLTHAERLIGDKTVTAFEPLFFLMNDIKVKNGEASYDEKLMDEMDFSWEEFRDWVVKTLLNDLYIRKHCNDYKKLIEYLNDYKVPWFFFDNYLELFIMRAYFFSTTGLLYYIYVQGTEDEEEHDADLDDWLEEEEEGVYTFRVLDVQKKRVRLEEGDILYYGPSEIEYIKRTNAIGMKFSGLDWYACFSLDTKQVEEIFYHRYLLGVTDNGEEVFLRDSEDGTKLEVCYVNRLGVEEFVMNYRSDCWFWDGAFRSDIWYSPKTVKRAFSIDMKGKKRYCSIQDWKRMIWMHMLKGIETSGTDYFSFGGGLIRRILRMNRNLELPKMFSCDELQQRLWNIREEQSGYKRRTGRILACLSLFKQKGIKGDEDLFEFFKCAVQNWKDKQEDTYLCLKEFIAFVEKKAEEEEFTNLVRNHPKQIFDGYRRNEEEGYRSCNNLKDFFGFLLNKGTVGAFGMVDGALRCRREYIRNGELRDGRVIMKKSREENMTGRVYFDLAANMHVIEWPDDISMRWLHDVKKRFYITGRWTIVNK